MCPIPAPPGFLVNGCLPPGWDIENHKRTREERIIELREELARLEFSVAEESHRSAESESLPGA